MARMVAVDTASAVSRVGARRCHAACCLHLQARNRCIPRPCAGIVRLKALGAVGTGLRSFSTDAGNNKPSAGAITGHPLKSQPVQFEDHSDVRKYLPETFLLGLWNKFSLWRWRQRGGRSYPAEVTTCNSGADFGITIPRPELLMHDGIERGSQHWKLQIYGAALYWHLATTPGEDPHKTDPDLLRGKDVLEVACMRGGGAYYLAEAAGPQLYVAADGDEKHLELCRQRYNLLPQLRFEHAGIGSLRNSFLASSFDFVLCAELNELLEDAYGFMSGVAHALRPGGCFIFCDALTSNSLRELLDAAQAVGLTCEVCVDISRAVIVAGVQNIPPGHLYLRMIFRKDERVGKD